MWLACFLSAGRLGTLCTTQRCSADRRLSQSGAPSSPAALQRRLRFSFRPCSPSHWRLPHGVSLRDCDVFSLRSRSLSLALSADVYMARAAAAAMQQGGSGDAGGVLISEGLYRKAFSILVSPSQCAAHARTVCCAPRVTAMSHPKVCRAAQGITLASQTVGPSKHFLTGPLEALFKARYGQARACAGEASLRDTLPCGAGASLRLEMESLAEHTDALPSSFGRCCTSPGRCGGWRRRGGQRKPWTARWTRGRTVLMRRAAVPYALSLCTLPPLFS